VLPLRPVEVAALPVLITFNINIVEVDSLSSYISSFCCLAWGFYSISWLLTLVQVSGDMSAASILQNYGECSKSKMNREDNDFLIAVFLKGSILTEGIENLPLSLRVAQSVRATAPTVEMTSRWRLRTIIATGSALLPLLLTATNGMLVGGDR
jgi:hypothetical protein